MKYLFAFLALFLARQASGQDTSMTGRVLNSDSHHGFGGATLLFKQGNAAVTGTVTDSTGRFEVAGLPAGTYEVEIKAIGYRTKSVSGVIVSPNARPLALTFPGPCELRYPAQGLPTCVGGHTDQFLPIVYGLPGKKELARAKAGKIYLGGCLVSGCDPKYYCPIHQKEL